MFNYQFLYYKYAAVQVTEKTYSHDRIHYKDQ